MIDLFRFIGNQNTWFYFSIILLSSLILLSFYNIYGIANPFPFKPSDVSVHMTNLYFLLNYGFHGWVPNWYEGYNLFLLYPPLYTYYVLPFYAALGSIPFAFFFSIISNYVLLGVAVYILCKIQKFSRLKTAIFFLTVFATRFGLANFFEGIRVGESIGWVLFTLLFAIIMYYRDRPLDRNFVLTFVPTVSLMILSHPYFLIFGPMLILPFMLMKKVKDFSIAAASVTASLILTAFWWFPFVTSYVSDGGNKDPLFVAIITSGGLLNRAWIITIPILFWASFYLYYKEKGEKKDVYMVAPFVILSLLFFTGIAGYVPVLSEMALQSYCIIFLFMTMFYFLKKDSYKELAEKSVVFSVAVLLPIVSAASYLYPLNEFFFINYNNKPLFKDVVSIMPSISGSFIASPERDEGSLGYFYGNCGITTYATIYYNLSTPSGWFPSAATPQRLKDIEGFDRSVVNGDCAGVYAFGDNMLVDEILTIEHYCDGLNKCPGLRMKVKTEHVCLFDVVK